jgi:hypothetical protein
MIFTSHYLSLIFTILFCSVTSSVPSVAVQRGRGGCGEGLSHLHGRGQRAGVRHVAGDTRKHTHTHNLSETETKIH